ncbi:DUF2165 family protein [Acidisoma sp. C75]
MPDRVTRPPLLLRACRIALVAAMALFFTVIALGNITDYETNRQFVRHVMAMDTIFPQSKLPARVIADPAIQTAVYCLIIASECVIAALLWIGALQMLRTIRAARPDRAIAAAGLTLGLLLYLVGFVTIAAEWFAMWQSGSWNAQPTALAFSVLIGVVLAVLLLPEDAA